MEKVRKLKAAPHPVEVPVAPEFEMLLAEPAPAPEYEMLLIVGRYTMIRGKSAVVFSEHTVRGVVEPSVEIYRAMKECEGRLATIECYNVIREKDRTIPILQWRFQMY